MASGWWLPPLEAFGGEYPMLQEIVRRAHTAVAAKPNEEQYNPAVQVTRDEWGRIHEEMDKWAATHGDMAENPHHLTKFGAVKIEVIDG